MLCIAAARTCLEVDGYDSLLVTSGSDTTSMQFNWVAGPATTQSDFFKGMSLSIYSRAGQRQCADAC